MNIQIERKKDVLERVKISRSTLHRWINDGMFPPSISLGAKSVGFLSHEVDETLKAMALNKDIKAVVKSIIENREDIL